jgi:hypothetical protein
MIKYEYKTLPVQVKETGPEIDLNKWGVDGWELVTVIPRSGVLTLPELVVKPGIGRQTVTSQQSATIVNTLLIYVLRRIID